MFLTPCAHYQEVKIKNKLLQKNNIQITYQMLSLLKVILSQNYFMFQQKIYQPAQSISMGVTDFQPNCRNIPAAL